MAPTQRSLPSTPSERSSSSNSSSAAAMLLLVVGYLVALTEKLQMEFRNVYNSSSGSSSSRSDAAPPSSWALEPTRKRHDEEEVRVPGHQGEGLQQKPKQRHRGSNRLQFSAAAFVRKFSSQKQQQQQQQQHQHQCQHQQSRGLAFAAPSSASDDDPPAAARRGSGATAWAQKARLGGSGSDIRSSPRCTPHPGRGLLPAAASTSRVRRTDKTLCLDLDETLIHARGDARDMGENRFDFMLVLPQQQQRHHRHDKEELAGPDQPQQQCSAAGGEGPEGVGKEGADSNDDGRRLRFFVRKRPHLTEFLQEASDMFEVVLFTAAPAEFAHAVVEQIDPERKFVDHVLSRESCTQLKMDGSSSTSSSSRGRGKWRGGGERGPTSVVKDLEVVGRPLSKVIMVENSLDAIRYHLENGVHISSFYGDREDTELLSTLEALKALAPMADVRDGIIRLSVETQARKEGHTLMPDGSISPASERT